MTKPNQQPTTHVLQIIERLRATSSRNEKEAILTELKKTAEIEEQVQQFFYMTYDPLINYWYSGPFETDKKPPGQFSLFDDIVTHDLGTVKNRVVTGNKGRALLQNVCDSLTYQDRELFNLVLARDAKCGVTATTINKIWPGLVPVFSVMLCQNYDDKTKKKIKFPAYVQLKYDASRVCVFVDEFCVTYKTRNGKTYFIDDHELDTEFLELRTKILERLGNLENATQQLVFDGELYQINDVTGKIENRQTSNGVATKLIRNTASEQETHRIGITLWDFVTIDSFIAGKDTTKYKDRLGLLYSALFGTSISRTQSDENHMTYSGDKKRRRVFLAETKTVESEKEALQWSDELIEKGEEGVIIKNVDGPWQNKRSNDCLKIKAVLEADLKITGFEYGKGKYADKIGALLCETADGKVKVAVGSGLSDEQRSTLFLSATDNVIGKIAAIKYNAVIPNAEKNSDGYTLFLPRFVEIREDKTEADIITL